MGVISNILEDLENPQMTAGDFASAVSNPTFQRVMQKVKEELEIIYEEIEEDEDQDLDIEEEIR